ncbi:hypothetical protein [Thiocystis violascens]|uniref:WGR domain-containing protein n=1 Tax=Thiocystis violascens (strain ATCC 17096 / DSM 198 / 6111) TaxID=765911 RepID=I3Y6L7_THIV6|nr:hypothetical protein [Thiocystis violascens]AFL72635.1 hypothetical protein Thivi_0577 [Thiocystis violascens DSM 198]
MKSFALYRYTHPDGTAKEWAYSHLGNGTAEIRWGPSNQLRQCQIKPLREAQERAQQKLGKGYRPIGTIWLDDAGRPVNTHAVRPLRKNTVDLTTLLGPGDSFYF